MPPRLFTLFPKLEKAWLHNLGLNPSPSASWLVTSGSEDGSEVLSAIPVLTKEKEVGLWSSPRLPTN